MNEEDRWYTDERDIYSEFSIPEFPLSSSEKCQQNKENSHWNIIDDYFSMEETIWNNHSSQLGLGKWLGWQQWGNFIHSFSK